MYALLSVSDKTGIIDFARGLIARGLVVASTGGTARVLTEAGISVVPVPDITGAPEMMDGRVKTLHPRIHGGILARRDHAGDREALSRFGITPIDVVAVNLYPFRQAAGNPSTPVPELVEEIDIGGPSMIRAAAKNFPHVLVAVSPSDYPAILDALDQPGGPPLGFRLTLGQKAFMHTALYDAAIATELERVTLGPSGLQRQLGGAPVFGPHVAIGLRKLRDLRYGENPHQMAAWYAPDFGAEADLPSVLQGKELSFTNLLDLDAAARIVREFDEPASVVIKHTNPCGAATGSSLADAYVRARDADAISAFGGIVGCNRPIDEDAARAMASTFIEAVVATGISDAALAVLATKKNLRVVIVPSRVTSGASAWADADVRTALGGLLFQARDRVSEAVEPWPIGGVPEVVTRRQPTSDEWRALRFAWRICAHVKSNAVIFTDATRTLAIGAGQTSRVDAVKVAVMKAGSSQPPVMLEGSVAASDAFFPFRDGLDAVAAAGASAIVQPGGSVRDAEVIAAADEQGVAMVFTRRRHFRH
jgi:phosphoribosylaminoimidazolecarboxamide formyltransferase/IMP cyclohydrolase